jgi:hypothetical protein
MAKIIVNPLGGVHSVTDDHAEVLLAQPGYREAERAEAAAWLKEFGGKAAKENSAPASAAAAD